MFNCLRDRNPIDERLSYTATKAPINLMYNFLSSNWTVQNTQARNVAVRKVVTSDPQSLHIDLIVKIILIEYVMYVYIQLRALPQHT